LGSVAMLLRLFDQPVDPFLMLAARVRLKYNPQLFFALDPGPEHQERIDRLIEETKKHGH
ncbi:MAG: hypothetical protein IH583_04985, partial [Candidatus Aminicenantes bacterium]|nr:hypothetical protein [Candidatus Aminicenantes bacterium]